MLKNSGLESARGSISILLYSTDTKKINKMAHVDRWNAPAWSGSSARWIGVATTALIMIAATLPSGCSSNFLPSITDDAPDAPSDTAKPATTVASTGSTTVTSGPSASAAITPSSTYVGQKIAGFKADAARLQEQLATHSTMFNQIEADTAQTSQSYFAQTGTINAHLQAGTTPGNPELSQKWTEAQADLDRMGDAASRLNQLMGLVAGDASMSTYLLDNIRAAFGLPGAIDADHVALQVLEDEVGRAGVVINRLQSQVTDQASRQNAYVSNERFNLTTLAVAIKTGELYGNSLANRSFQAAGFAASPTTASTIGSRRPLVVIRFDKASVPFEQTLYSAVNQAIQRRPDVNFDLVAVTPASAAGKGALGSAAAQRNAETVLRSLADMGLAANRVTLSAITSPTADVNEVQLFVR